MTEYSLVPSMIAHKKITFVNENSIPVKLCEPSPFVYNCPFKQPSFMFDKFAKKTTRLDKIVTISYDDLKKLGYCIYGYKTTRKTRWRPRQLWIWIIDKISSQNPGARVLNNTPKDHRIIHDTENNLVKLLGENAGPKHFIDGGNWVKVNTNIKEIKNA
jgi:hypothetical protein